MSVLMKYLWGKIFEDNSTQQADKDTEYLQAGEEAAVEKENSAAEKCKQSVTKLEETIKTYDKKAGTDPKDKMAEIDKDVAEFDKKILEEQAKILGEIGITVDIDTDPKKLKEAIKEAKKGLSKEKKEAFDKSVEESEDIKNLNKKIEGAKKKKDKLKEEKEVYDAKKAQWAKYKAKLQEQVNKLKTVATKLADFERKIKEFKQKRRVSEAKIKEAIAASEANKKDREEATKELINNMTQQAKLAKEALEAKKEAIRADIEQKRQQAQIDAKEEAEKSERDAIQAALASESEKSEKKIKDIEDQEKKLTNLNKERQTLQGSLGELESIKNDFNTKKTEYDAIQESASEYNKEGDENPLRTAAKHLVEANNAKTIMLDSLKLEYKRKYPDEFDDEGNLKGGGTFPTEDQKAKLSTEKEFRSTWKCYEANVKAANKAGEDFKKTCYDAQVANKKATGENCGVDLSGINGLRDIVEGSVSDIAQNYAENNSVDNALNKAKETTTSENMLTVKINGKSKKIYWDDPNWKYEDGNPLTQDDEKNITINGAVESIPTEKMKEPKMPDDLEKQIDDVKGLIKSKDKEINDERSKYNELTGAKLQTTINSDTDQQTTTQEEDDIKNKENLQSHIDSITDDNEKKEFLKSIGLKEEDYDENGKLKDDIDEKRLAKAIKKSNEEIEEIEGETSDGEDISDEEAAKDDEQHDDDKLGKDDDGKPQPPKRKIVKKTTHKRTKDGRKVKSTKYIAYTKDKDGKTTSYESNEEDLKSNQRAWKKYKKRYAKWKSEQNESITLFLKNNINESCNKSNLKKYLYSKL